MNSPFSPRLTGVGKCICVSFVVNKNLSIFICSKFQKFKFLRLFLNLKSLLACFIEGSSGAFSLLSLFFSPSRVLLPNEYLEGACHPKAWSIEPTWRWFTFAIVWILVLLGICKFESISKSAGYCFPPGKSSVNPIQDGCVIRSAFCRLSSNVLPIAMTWKHRRLEMLMMFKILYV